MGPLRILSGTILRYGNESENYQHFMLINEIIDKEMKRNGQNEIKKI